VARASYPFPWVDQEARPIKTALVVKCIPGDPRELRLVRMLVRPIGSNENVVVVCNTCSHLS